MRTRAVPVALVLVLAAPLALGGGSTAAGQQPDPCTPWTTRVVASGLGSLENLEPDGAGGMLLSASDRDAVERLLPDGTVETVAADVDRPGGMRVRDGVLFVNTGDGAASGLAGTADGTIQRIDLATGDRTTYAEGLVMPNGLVFDGDGNAYTSRDLGADAMVTKVPATDPSAPDTAWADLADTNGLAVDPTGEWLYASTTFNAPAVVYRIALDDPTVIEEIAQLAGVGSPVPKGLDDLTIDGAGVLYLTANGSGEVLSLDPATGRACVVATGLQNPSAVKFGAGPGWDPAHLYVSAFDGRVVELLPPAPQPDGDGPDGAPTPADGPLPPDFACPATSWVAGTTELCDGVLTHRDYVYDDYGADLGTTASTTGSLAIPAGDIRYPEGSPANTADLVDLSLRIAGDRLEVLAEVNALHDAGSTIVALAIDTDADPATGGGPWPGFGVASEGWDELHTFTAADPLANLVGGSIPRPAGDTWRLQAVTAQADGAAAGVETAHAVMNVAFRGPDERADFVIQGVSPPSTGAWFEDLQAAALAAGDISAFGQTVSVADLEGGVTRALTEVGPGLHSRVYTSDLTLPPGEGMSYAGIDGRGTGGPTGAFGQVFFHFGRYQPYGLYLPEDDPSAGPRPLVMLYHGSNQSHAGLINLPGLQQQVGQAHGRILASPLARGVHGYGSDISERDLEDVEADVRATYDVDPDRVMTAGYSQGGYVALRQAAMHPDRFAALTSWVGFTGDATNPAPADQVTAGAVGNVIDFVGNHRHVAPGLIYGGADELVSVTSSEALATAYRQLDFPYTFWQHPTAEHFTFALLDEWSKESDYAAGWTRAVDPLRVTFRAAEVLGDVDAGIRHDTAHWVSQLRGRDTVTDHAVAEDAYIDVDLTSEGCGGAVPTVELVPGAGPSPEPWVSEAHVVSGEAAVPAAAVLRGSLVNVRSLAVDVTATCLTGAFAYDIASDGPAVLRLSDGRRIDLPEAGGAGEVAAPAPPPPPRRLAGTDRIGTAVAVSAATHETAATVVLARADAYADALAAGPLAAALGAPLLLTGRDGLDPAVAAEVGRLGATDAVLVGGSAALAPAVESALTGSGLAVRRLEGGDRFATAAAVAAAVVEAGGDGTTAYLVEGADPDPARGWPDAVAAGALAARQGRPILLATTEAVPPSTLGALATLGTTRVIAVGGTSAVTDRTLAMAADPDGDGSGQVALDRIRGSDRYATAAAVADRTLDDLATTEQVWVVTGRDWPDALTAGPAAAASGGVLLLVDGATQDGGPTARAWLGANGPAEDVVLVGGESVLRGITR
jgi:putative cell wall-binding protein/sugar lactone lactonase YvrE/predicted esterase